MLNYFTIPAMLLNSFSRFGDKQSLVFVGEENRNYSQLQVEINNVINLLIGSGIYNGDKVAILSSNMPNWGITFFAITSIGGIVVPLLPDFSAIEISNILVHSEAKCIFVSESLIPKLAKSSNELLKLIFNIETFRPILGAANNDNTVSPSTISTFNVREDDVASIIYTSGTTGKSKGVMLTHRNLTWNAVQCSSIHVVTSNDRFLSLLPLSHTYENTIGFLFPVLCGASIHYLKKLPTPAVLIPALQIVKPTAMLSVPLIIEKIYKKQIEPKFSNGHIIRFLYGIYPVRLLLNRIAGKKLMKTFGGHISFFGIGGAKLDGKVERFLKEAKFPYSIGYGLTETAPLLAGAGPEISRWQTIGPPLLGVDLKINQPDPNTGQGEIWAKGPNVMKGYYKEPELTKEVITEDGWFKTGDLGIFDKKGYLAFKGRLKNLIVSASGENIYPEEIEEIINNFKHVVESLVIERKGKLVALVMLNKEELEAKFQQFFDQAEAYNEKFDELIGQLLIELQHHVNSHVSKFSQVQQFIFQQEPFERTPTQKIKRFLYT